jgi:2-iminoacetate synthase
MQKKQNELFINREKLYSIIEDTNPTEEKFKNALNKALKMQGLDLSDVAILLKAEAKEQIAEIMETARIVKENIYGKRLVLFAPLYTGNECMNNCVYCAFRKDNENLKRKILSMDEIEIEVKSLLKEGHKRVLLICGESQNNNTDYIAEAIRKVYSVNEGGHKVRRINVELAPMSEIDFAKLKAENIGTYVCFQETYDSILYAKYHPAGTPKADYEYRLTVMDRAMSAGIDDVGLGALFGLADYRFEILALMEHSAHLEKVFGCGPHTISFPRIEPADNAPLTNKIPHPVSDDDFKKIIAIIRIALPYTGIILSTREKSELRSELFRYGVSQISAGSRTNPGAYSDDKSQTGSQFSLGDHRSLDEVIADIVEYGYIPSFCTGCYRQGRVGHDFMDLAKPGLIKEYCMPNAIFTFEEYLNDFASPETKKRGCELIASLVSQTEDLALKEKMSKIISEIDTGKRDVYF